MCKRIVVCLIITIVLAGSVHAQPLMESLNRGVVAVKTGENSAFVSWRLLDTDPSAICFDLYRQSDNKESIKLNKYPLTVNTYFHDTLASFDKDLTYRVKAIVKGKDTPVNRQLKLLTASREESSIPKKNPVYSSLTPPQGAGNAFAEFKLKSDAVLGQYLSIPLRTPDNYSPGDCSTGDLDGDGEYEIIVHMVGIGRDNGQNGLTTAPIVQAYKLDGTFLWEINLGLNIREGAHYTQFLVYDFDGDGKAEMICKTADGSIDGLGNIIGDAQADWRTKTTNGNMDPWAGMSARFSRSSMLQDSGVPGHYSLSDNAAIRAGLSDSAAIGAVLNRQEVVTDSFPKGGRPRQMPPNEGRRRRPMGDINPLAGKIVDGPEYLTVFEGTTGRALATVDYIPERGDTGLWGDNRANRSERYLAGVAYLDGKNPSAVMCRGYYTRATLVAWDWRDGKLTQRWFFDSYDGTPGNEAYSGQGNHSLSVADVDQDGFDEIIYGACVIDHDGKGLYSTGFGHGDAMHCSDLDPERPGLEVFQVHEDIRKSAAVAGGHFRDAKTGELIWGHPGLEDVGRGMCADIDPRFAGYECWSVATNSLFSAKGEKIADRHPRSCNFAIWWDGDFSRELLDRNYISKWDYETGKDVEIFRADSCMSINGSKATPNLSADLFGDWREEVILSHLNRKELRIFTTILPTEHRMVTLMHDRQYRLAIAWQNVAYNQPPHPSFFLGTGMKLHENPK